MKTINMNLKSAKLIKREDWLAMEQARVDSALELQDRSTRQSKLIFARRDFLLAKRECNSSAKQRFMGLFKS